MSIIRTEKNQNYSTINNSCFQDDSLSARAKGIFAYIMTLPDNWKLYKRELYSHFKEGRGAIDTAFKELEDAGYIEKKVVHEDGKLNGWTFTVYETPQNAQEPESLVSSKSENPQLLSTNIKPSTKRTNKKINKKVSVPEKTIDEFKREVWESGKTLYQPEMLKDFFEYWSMDSKFLKEKKFNMSGRLSTWRRKGGWPKIEDKKKYRDSVYLSDSEYGKVSELYPSDYDVRRGIEILDNHKMAKGRHYESDYHVMIGWVHQSILKEIKDLGLEKELF